jgi:hypothetical protein
MLDEHGITLRHYYFPMAAAKHIPYDRVHGAEVRAMGWLTGKARIWGTARLSFWLPLDLRRMRKSRLVVLDLGRRVQPAFSPDDPDWCCPSSSNTWAFPSTSDVPSVIWLITRDGRNPDRLRSLPRILPDRSGSREPQQRVDPEVADVGPGRADGDDRSDHEQVAALGQSRRDADRRTCRDNRHDRSHHEHTEQPGEVAESDTWISHSIRPRS